jgi:DsbC/DsbD-like thiol-disulfide interchange protein
VSGVGANAGMAGMAFPGTFLLDRQGRVTSRFFEDFYIDRNTASSVMLQLGAGAAPVAATKISTGQIEITTFASDTAVAPGNRFSLAFDVAPHAGMHVYAPGASGYKTVSVAIAPQPFVRVLSLQYPRSEIYFFKPLNERVPTYQKPFRLVQEVLLEGTPQAQAALQGKESLTITGSVEYQACNDNVCFNPASVPVTWTLTLRPIIRERPVVPPR